MPRFQAVIFDWAGTTVDYGSRAPTLVVIEVFRRCGIEMTEAEARGPMGMSKREHIRTLLQLPRVAAAWNRQHGHAPTDADVQTLYHTFLPLQQETLRQHTEMIPGVPEAVAECRRRGLKVGSTTGYTRALMDVVEPIAARAGYRPDVTICSDEVPAGRPAPWMNFRAAERLGVYPMSTCLVVDDTPVGIAAGLNAGATTVAISQTGNSLGLSLAETDALPRDELQARLAAIEHQFRQSGAHYVLRSATELPALLDQLGD